MEQGSFSPLPCLASPALVDKKAHSLHLSGPFWRGEDIGIGRSKISGPGICCHCLHVGFRTHLEIMPPLASADIYLGQIGEWGPPAFLGSGVVAARVRPAWESDCPGLCAASLLTCWGSLGQVTQFPHL